ncbi:MAG: LemA family protein [Thermoplasmatota archaeon]
MVVGIIAGVIAIVAIVVLAFWIIGLYNRIVRLENQIDNSWGQIDVQLQRRGELIPNLINTVKGYAKHEKETLQAVTDARAGLMNASNPAAKMAADGVLGQALGRLFAVAEAYPDLKANTNFLQLQDELVHTENKISFARQNYNDTVTAFNNAIEVLPSNIVANMFGKGNERPVLEAPEATRAVPEVSF